MNKLFIVFNHKSYKTYDEAKEWLSEIKNIDKSLLEQKQIVICPPFTLLSQFKTFFQANNLNIKLGAQDVSPFDEGSYTGEVNAKQIKEFATYVLIGHSERRSNFNETDQLLAQKVNLSLQYGLHPIYLVQDKDTVIPSGVKLIAYEPIFAIGSGNPDTPENADEVARLIKQTGSYQVLYGGSVTSQNVKNFTAKPNINGVLVGGASLDAEEFIKIIKNAK